MSGCFPHSSPHLQRCAMGHAITTTTQRSRPVDRRAASFAIDAQLRAIARSQLGLLTREQATNAGVDKHALARRRASGALVEIFPGVMRVDPVEATIEQRIRRRWSCCSGIDHHRSVCGSGVPLPGARTQRIRPTQSGVEYLQNSCRKSPRHSNRSAGRVPAESPLDDLPARNANGHVARAPAFRRWRGGRRMSRPRIEPSTHDGTRAYGSAHSPSVERIAGTQAAPRAAHRSTRRGRSPKWFGTTGGAMAERRTAGAIPEQLSRCDRQSADH